MKKNLLLAASLFVSAFAMAQTEVTIPMEPAYAKQVYYKFSTNTQTPVTATSWDLAIEKAPGMMSLGGIRVNDGIGIRTFQASASVADWATINVANEGTWTELYNSDTEWGVGSIDEGTAGYGWGEYDLNGDHHVTGTVIFVLRYSATSYKKVMIEDYNPYINTITVKYSVWDSVTSTWGADQTYVVNNNALAAGNSWNYVSLTTNNAVTVAPADADWDLVFRKYYTEVTAQGQTAMYNVTGALHNANVTVAQVDVAGTTAPAIPADDTFSENINAVGDDWKAFGGGVYTMADRTYFLKYANGAVYRFYFTSFAGQATGNLTFNAQNVAIAGLEELNNNVSFGIYPNPTANKNITLVYDLKNNAADKNTVSIYALSGAKVFETEITNNSGFYTKDLNLSNLSSGMYIVKMEAGNASVTQKLVIQ
jgi:hypothetical protein